MRPLRNVTAALAILAGLWACGEAADPAEEVLRARQRFSLELLSWVPLPDGTIALDLQASLTGPNGLELLTVAIRQVGPDQSVLRADTVVLDVSGVESDGRAILTVRVPAAGESVAGVGAVLEAIPPESERGAYPEFAAAVD